MSYMNVGTIDYHGTIYTVYVGSDPELADASWNAQKAQYFPDYEGPPPAGLNKNSSSAIEKRVEHKRDLFA
jgi:hypothetical protein